MVKHSELKCIYLVLRLDVKLLHLLDGKSDGVLIVAGHHNTNPLLLSMILKMFDSVHAVQQTSKDKITNGNHVSIDRSYL